jgi:hypothetical protein
MLTVQNISKLKDINQMLKDGIIVLSKFITDEQMQDYSKELLDKVHKLELEI